MTLPITDPHNYDQKARQIRAQVTRILTKWGLLPRFKRWRLTQDPSTGMVVLFGVLNNKFIATHTSTPFSDYFDPRILHDLANELQVQIVSCNSDGLRYAFILDPGQLRVLPTHIDFPFVDNSKVVVRVVYSEPVPSAPATIAAGDDQALVRQGVKAFLKVLDDIKLRDDIALQMAEESLPNIVLIDENEFKKRVAENEAERLRVKHIKSLFKVTQA